MIHDKNVSRMRKADLVPFNGLTAPVKCHSLYSGTRQAFWHLARKASIPKALAASATALCRQSECHEAPASVSVPAFMITQRYAHAFRLSKSTGRLSRSGQAMVEFAIISFLLTAMLAGFLGIIVLGLGSFQNNLAAESAGRLLDRALPNTLTSSDSVYEELVTSGLYDESRLIISSADWYDSAFRSALPEINRALLGNYIYDPDLDAFRYPGAVVQNSASQQTVLIPLLKDTNPPLAKGIDRAFNVSVGDTPVADDWVGPVTVSKIDDENYRLVIFYPSQPASMLNLELVRDAEGRILTQTPVEADDSAITLSALPAGYSFATPPVNPDVDASVSRGKYGLGQTFAFLKAVRPYRRVFESASVFRLAE